MNVFYAAHGGNSLSGLARSLNASANPRLVRELQAKRRSMGLVPIPGAIGNPAVPYTVRAVTPPRPASAAYRPPITPAVRAARDAERCRRFKALQLKAGRKLDEMRELLRTSRKAARARRGCSW